MAVKHVDIPSLGPVTLIKSARSSTIRLTITERGVRVSLPRFIPYAAGITFARQHADWIREQTAKHQKPPVVAGQKVGKLHSVAFKPAPLNAKPASRITASEVIVQLAAHETPLSVNAQDRAQKAIVRTLKKEAALLLPPRLANKAQLHAITYRSIQVKQLKRRWGSCDSQQNIVLNLFLMELPWVLIDYVICHELAHIDHMNHGSGFWNRLEQLYPHARQANRQLRTYQPIITGRPTSQTEAEEDLL